MKIVDLATELFIEIGEPSYTSIPAISYFLRSKIGEINDLLFEDFIIESSSGQYEILDAGGVEISVNAAAILKKIYLVYSYDILIRANMNLLSQDSLLEFTDNLQGSTVRRTNRNEVSKTYATLKSAEQKNLNDLITAYRIKGAIPSQVTGDDFVAGVYNENNPTVRQNVVL